MVAMKRPSSFGGINSSQELKKFIRISPNIGAADGQAQYIMEHTR
jgi:hypothetical protein